MDKIRINGKANLYGEIGVSGSKNAALPILVSSLLSDSDLILDNVPDLEDIRSMVKLLKGYGVKCIQNKKKITLNDEYPNNAPRRPNYSHARKASSFVSQALTQRLEHCLNDWSMAKQLEHVSTIEACLNRRNFELTKKLYFNYIFINRYQIFVIFLYL